MHSAFNIFALLSLQEVRIGTLDTLNTSTSGEFDTTPWNGGSLHSPLHHNRKHLHVQAWV